ATDANGNFSIAVSRNQTLVISAINFGTKEIKVSSADVLQVSLANTDKSLSEVVVVGYGSQRKEAVTGSVASISGDRMREVPSPNITQAIQGRIAGVDISQTSTKPGAT